ncbi:hypothetical protein [Agrobacterium sp. LMR679]|uniref:hypothetical protein n=1 Tax=Agrobacterium sp. LMR679 TaxID=3014335 RepID=UPI0022B0683A|nr:hypothetical protein [Agrobacterium sp. LMR679]MCZ4072729.1 hypothetical protein [Agrobacterium sp. LMR679]
MTRRYFSLAFFACLTAFSTFARGTVVFALNLVRFVVHAVAQASRFPLGASRPAEGLQFQGNRQAEGHLPRKLADQRTVSALPPLDLLLIELTFRGWPSGRPFPQLETLPCTPPSPT